MSDDRYEIKTSLPVIWLWNIDCEKSGSVRLNEQRTTDPGSWLVDPVDDDDEDPGLQTSDLQRLIMRDLKKRKELFTHLDRIDHHFTLASAI